MITQIKRLYYLKWKTSREKLTPLNKTTYILNKFKKNIISQKIRFLNNDF